MYQLRFAGYCGMSAPVLTYDDEHEGRAAAAALLHRRRRLGMPCVTLERGRSWEVLEPEGAVMVPDSCGLLTLEHVTHECRECGAEHETREDARACCIYDSEPELFDQSEEG